MDMRKIRKLIELLQETGIAEIEIKEGEESVRISRELAEQLHRTLISTAACLSLTLCQKHSLRSTSSACR